MTNVTRSDAQANRARLVEAARSLIAERGRDVEMKEIADRAGVGIGTIYRNFGTKRGLVQAIVDSSIADAVLDVRAIIEESDGRERVQRLVAVTWKHAECSGALFDAIGIPTTEATGPLDPLLALITSALAGAQAAGVVRPGVEPAFLARFLAAQFGVFVELRAEYPPDHLAANLTELVLAALLVQEMPNNRA